MILILNKIKLYTYCSVVFRRRFTYQLLPTGEAAVLETLTSNNPLQLSEAKFLLSRPNTPKHDLLLEVLTLHGNELLVVKPRFEPITSLTTSLYYLSFIKLLAALLIHKIVFFYYEREIEKYFLSKPQKKVYVF